MTKMTIKSFCTEYNNLATDTLKARYIKDKLEINTYVPFVNKVALAEGILNATMIDKTTGNVKQNSAAEYLLLTRVLIENYTNLTVETPGFFEEYDELKKSGLFNKLLIGTEDTLPLIPYEEITEFKHILDLKQKDLLSNKYEIHSFIQDQVERFSTIGSTMLKPALDKIGEGILNMDDDKVGRIIAAVEKVAKKNAKKMTVVK